MKTRRPVTLLILFSCLLVSALTRADTHYVDASNTTPLAPYTSWETAATELWRVAFHVTPGDSVLVAPGVYSMSSAVLHVTVKSVGGPAVTEIRGRGPEGGNPSRCVWLSSGVLDGFTLTGGYADHGGGVYNNDGTVRNCIITGNTATERGGGVNCVGDDSIVDNCLIYGNHADVGGGVHSLYPQTVLRGCTIVDNTADSYSGGIEFGGGSARNCIVWGNTATSNENWGAHGSNDWTCVHSCISPTLGLSDGTGCIEADPIFVDVPSHDYTIQAWSPCVDAGDNAYVDSYYDLGHNLRIVDGVVDMGAYENQKDLHLVSPLGGHVAPFLTWPTAATNIQAAIDACGAGHTVLVTNGTYDAGGTAVPNALHDMPTRAVVTNGVTVRSVNGPSVTRIVGQGPVGAAAVRGAFVGDDCTLEGFTIDSGHTREDATFEYDIYGGGVFVGAGGMMSNCVVTNCRANSRGGGGYLSGGTITDSQFLQCSASLGGGLVVSNGTVAACTLAGNVASVHGGGAYLRGGSVMSHCTLSANRADYGGAMYMVGAELARNCLMYGNRGDDGGGAVYMRSGGRLVQCTIAGNETDGNGGGVRFDGVSTNLNCIIYGNDSPAGDNVAHVGGIVRYENCCVWPTGGLSEAVGCTDADPRFVDTNAANYRLSADSPCLNAGSNAHVSWGTDLDGTTRIVDGVVDIGAYEGRVVHHYVSPSGSHTPPFANWTGAATNIQAAVDVAEAGDTVYVGAGTYDTGGVVAPGATLLNRLLVTNAVKVLGVDGPESTFIVGEPGGGADAVRCAFLTNGATLVGFSLLNGSTLDEGSLAEDRLGGGAFCAGTSVLSNCTVSGCSGLSGGGVLLLAGATLAHCRIRDSHAAQWGGGVFFFEGGEAQGCLLTGNSAQSGGGVSVWQRGALRGCTISGNRATLSGGGIGSENALTVQNCIVYHNRASAGPDFSSGGSNWSYTACCMSSDPGGASNITDAPRFVDTNNANYGLSPESPCINAGNNAYVTCAVDLAGKGRIADGVVDIGAYEGEVFHHYVSPSGSHAYPYGSWATAATNIQAAVDVAEAGDTVYVGAGMYDTGSTVVPANYHELPNRVCITNAITVRSVDGPGTTAIVGRGPHGPDAVRCAYVTNGAALIGFTLTNGFTRSTGMPHHNQSAGGAYLHNGGVLSNCIVSGCSAVEVGGGVLCNYGGLIVRCSVVGNEADDGAGVFCDHDGMVLNSLVALNKAADRAGGIYHWLGSSAVNCTVAGNSANEGGGVYCLDGGVDRNTILYGNTATSPGENWWVGSGTAQFDHVCTVPAPVGSGHVTNDPHFVDAASGIFRVYAESPCVDAGLNSLVLGSQDLDGGARIAGLAVDLGAYESLPHYVALDGGHVYPYSSWSDAATNIQAAVDAASAGDSVTVSNGTYEVGTRTTPGGTVASRVVVTQAVTVVSVAGAGAATIRGGGSGDGDAVRCAYLVEGARMTGFTLADGRVHTNGTELVDTFGGGAFVGQDAELASCRITSCVAEIGGGVAAVDGGLVRGSTVEGCKAAWGGGAVLLSGGIVKQARITGNRAEEGGGGVYCSGSGLLQRCEVSQNLSHEKGGGVYCQDGSMVDRCIIVGNSAGEGGGGAWFISGGTIRDSLVAGNETDTWGGGVYFRRGGEAVGCTIAANTADFAGGGVSCYEGGDLKNSIVYHNTGGGDSNHYAYGAGWSFTNCCTAPDPGGSGVVTADPAFVSVQGADYHVSSVSLCKNAGSNTYAVGMVDLDGAPRILGGTVDIGCYEQSRDGSVSPPAIAEPVTVDAGASERHCTLDDAVWVVGSKAADSLVVRPNGSGGWTSAEIAQTLGGTAWSNTVDLSGLPLRETLFLEYRSAHSSLAMVASHGTTLEVIRYGAPFVAFTNAPATVTYDVQQYELAGTNNAYVVGVMRVTNQSTGQSRVFAASGSWRSPPLSLGVGANVVTVLCSNQYGIVTRDTSDVVRDVPGTGTPVLAVTDPNTSVRYDVGSFVVHGTANPNVVGTIRVRNANNGVETTFPAVAIWTAPPVALGHGSNMLTAYGTNLLGAVAQDSVTIWRQRARYVSLSGRHQFPYQTWEDAATNIQSAVLAAHAGDTVVVTNGAYVNGGMLAPDQGILCRVVITNVVEVVSVNGPDATSIVGAGPQGNDAIRCVYLKGDGLLSGFTITNGHTFGSSGGNYDPKSGGGAFIEGQGTVSNCVFRGNEAYFRGGGAFCNSGGTIADCEFLDNSAGWGGGGAACFSGGSLSGCGFQGNHSSEGGALHFRYGGAVTGATFVGNRVDDRGGAIYFDEGGGAERCVFRGNHADSPIGEKGDGGALYFHDGGEAADSLIVGNYADRRAGGVYFSGGGVVANCTITSNTADTAAGGAYVGDSGTLRNCVVWGNAAPDGANWRESLSSGWAIEYSCTSPTDHANITNCIDQDPRFVNESGGDHHLSAASLCIDAGSNPYAVGDTDLDGGPRILNGVVDMGCYETAFGDQDTDGDGLPDWWESLYAGNITNMAAGVDGDGDGVDNLGEYGADTNPGNSNSCFRVTCISNLPPMTVYFVSSSNRVYTLRRLGALTGQDWTNVPTQVRIPGSGGEDSLQDTNASAKSRYYSLEVEMP